MYVRQATGALAILCSTCAAVRAQEPPSGLTARFDITQRLEFSDNPDFVVDSTSDFFGRTVLGFGLESVRNIDRFTLNLGVDITEGRSDEAAIDYDNPSVRFTYDRETRRAAARVDLSYREANVDSDIDDGAFELDGNVINQSNGTRQTLNFGVDATMGRDAPIGTSLSWRYNAVTYSGTIDPDLTDQNSNTFFAQIDFRLSPRITFNVTGRYSEFDAEGNGVNRQTTALGMGADLEISPVLTANLGLSYDRIERSGDEVGTNEGISFGAGLTRAVPNGTWGLSFASDVSSNDDGRRSSLRLNRQMEFPRGALSYAVGVTGAVGTDPLVDINYTHEMRTAQLTFGFGQQVVTDDDNDERINTNLRANFDQQINNSSSYGVSLAFFGINDLSVAENDSQRIDLSLTYRHDLTRDWGLVGSFTHARLSEENASDRTRNTIFVGLQRSFLWNP